ncbi:MAG: glycosyltransferase [Gemmatimonadetes bacterium]|nr:glycosyltransferase [Gemmatimonadota bacterium]
MLDSLAFGSLASVLAVWAGYPTFVAIAAMLRVRRRAARAAAPPASASIVIASRESAEAIADRVRNCRDTDAPAALEIIVAVPGEHVDRTRAALASLVPEAIVVAGDPEGGKASGLNAGVRKASGDVLVFTDTHQRFDRRTIHALLDALSDPRIGAVSGALVLPPDSPPVVRAYWTFERWLRRAEARLHSTIGVTGAVYAMRRSAWVPLPAGLLLDDVWVPMRLVLAGFRIGFEPAALAHETRTHAPDQEYRRKVRTLTGILQLCAWQPALLLPWRNPVWIQFLFHKLLRLLTPYWVLILALWAAAGLARSLGTWTPPALAAIAIAALWLWRTRSKLGVRLRTLAMEAVLLQLATLKAGWNGLRGRWHVWDS